MVSWTIGAAFAVLAPVWTVSALSSAFVDGGIYYVLDAPVETSIEQYQSEVTTDQ